MANLVRTAKGNLVDLNQMFMDNQKAVALGNASMNARGDILKHGKVIKTVEEQREEYEEVAAKTTVTKNIPVSTQSDKLEKIVKEEVEELPTFKSKKKPAPKPLQEPINEKSVIPEPEQDDGISITDIFANN